MDWIERILWAAHFVHLHWCNFWWHKGLFNAVQCLIWHSLRVPVDFAQTPVCAVDPPSSHVSKNRSNQNQTLKQNVVLLAWPKCCLGRRQGLWERLRLTPCRCAVWNERSPRRRKDLIFGRDFVGLASEAATQALTCKLGIMNIDSSPRELSISWTATDFLMSFA